MSTKSGKRKRKRWQENEVRFLRDNYKTMNIHDISIKLDRSVDSIRLKASKLNLRKGYTYNKDFFKEWTEDMAYVLGY